MANNPRPTFLGRAPAVKSSAGRTRVCPHCKTTILESASICPACQGYLRFERSAEQPAAVAELSPLRVSGTIRHPEQGESWEYSMVLTIRNERGEEIARQVVGVGALHPLEERSFTLTVDIFRPGSGRR
jgi:hypothetical protein